jgi:peptide/nickel transport system permease protein
MKTSANIQSLTVMPLSGIWSRAFQSPGFVIGLILSLIILFGGLLSYIWTPGDVTIVNIAERLKAPSGEHMLGTDHFGRDILSMLMVGARNSIAVAFVAVGVGMAFGIPLGLWAAARGGIIDALLMRANDVIFAFPALLSAVMITAIFGPGAINAIIAIGIFNIPVFARVARAAAMALWPRDYILAARASGKSKFLITLQHILPNIMHLLIVQATIQFSLGILAEAALSYLGLGAQPPMPSWGRMLAEAQTMIAFAPHTALFPGFAIILSVLGLNLMGDGLRDALDPKLDRSR